MPYNAMQSLLSDTKLGENVADNIIAHRAAIKLGDRTDSHFYIRGCSIGRQSETVGIHCRVYKTASAKQGCMLASRGYDCILPAGDLLVGKKAVDKLAKSLYRA